MNGVKISKPYLLDTGRAGNPAASSPDTRGFPTPPRDGCGFISFPFKERTQRRPFQPKGTFRLNTCQLFKLCHRVMLQEYFPLRRNGRGEIFPLSLPHQLPTGNKRAQNQLTDRRTFGYFDRLPDCFFLFLRLSLYFA